MQEEWISAFDAFLVRHLVHQRHKAVGVEFGTVEAGWDEWLQSHDGPPLISRRNGGLSLVARACPTLRTAKLTSSQRTATMAQSGISCRSDSAGRQFAPTLAKVNTTRVDSVFRLTNNPSPAPATVVVMRGI